jgi:hypothetical protein
MTTAQFITLMVAQNQNATGKFCRYAANTIKQAGKQHQAFTRGSAGSKISTEAKKS